MTVESEDTAGQGNCFPSSRKTRLACVQPSASCLKLNEAVYTPYFADCKQEMSGKEITISQVEIAANSSYYDTIRFTLYS